MDFCEQMVRETNPEVFRRGPSGGVHVVDIGIRGLDLAHTLLDGYDAAILVDAMPRGGAPGTLYVLEPAATPPGPLGDSHGVDPVASLRLARMLGGTLPVLRLVGCEPGPPPAEDTMAVGLSAPVAAAVGEAVRLIDALIVDLREEAAPRA